MSVVAIIVTYNPELSRFRYVLNQASKQANHVIIVDNGSKTKDMLKNYATRLIIATSLRLTLTQVLPTH